MTRIALVQRDDGAWYRPDCGCRVDWFDGPPRKVVLTKGEQTLTGKVSPHIHLCAAHSREHAAASGDGAVRRLEGLARQTPTDWYTRDYPVDWHWSTSLVIHGTGDGPDADAIACMEQFAAEARNNWPAISAHIASLERRAQDAEAALRRTLEWLDGKTILTDVKLDATQPAPSDGAQEAE